MATAKSLLIPCVLVCLMSAKAARSQSEFVLRDARLAAHFQVSDGRLQIAEVEDLRSGAVLRPGELFSLQFADGAVLAASQMQIAAAPVEKQILPDAQASRDAEHLAGREICADLRAEGRGLTARWCAILRDGTNYLRQQVSFHAGSEPVQISEIRMFDLNAPAAHVAGTARGSPLVSGDFFFGFESPIAQSDIRQARVTSKVERVLPLEAGNSVTYSSVIGVAQPGQMRRGFLAYIEEERAHPYRTFLHYNTWYDLGGKYTEAEALDRVHSLGEELVKKRQVKMDSFLFDDGWDDPHSVWQFNHDLPDGFSKIHDAAKQYGFGIGVWLSPWGGYADRKTARIAAGQSSGYETVKGGFALSGPRYYRFFEQTCLTMMEKYGVNQFKFDGTGNVSTAFPGSLFDSDFSAAIHLIERLRRQEPGLFINLTTGTWPSPFWLRYADSIWRGGADHSFAGVGNWRQKWITYRDSETYRNVVQAGPLFPLNSLMLHGIIFGRTAEHLDADPGADFADEVDSYFGSGTDLQELYITPALLSQANWDELAEAAKWSRSNAQVLKDTHWIGGDPAKLEVYGWASWTPTKGIIVLRNPADRPQSYALDVEAAFELPAGAQRNYRAHSPWAADKRSKPVELRAGQAHRILLQPFEVLTLDAVPQRD